MGRGSGGGGGRGGGGRAGGGGKAGAKVGLGGGGGGGGVAPAKTPPAAKEEFGLPKTGQVDPVKQQQYRDAQAAYDAIEGKPIFERPDLLHEVEVDAIYADLPDAGDAGRVVRSDGSILPPTAGAPDLPSKLLSDEAAYNKLKKIGATRDVLNHLEDNGSLQEIATILPDKARIMGEPGFEGMGVDVGDGKVWRVQYRGTERPIPAYDVGKAGVYPEWEKQYGNTWITQKEKMIGIADDVPYQAPYAVEFLEQKIAGDRPNVRWNFDDMHGGNYGNDKAGRWRLLDQGAAVPQGADIVADMGALNAPFQSPGRLVAEAAAKAAKRKKRN